MCLANDGDGVVRSEKIENLDYEAIGAVLDRNHAIVSGAVAYGLEDGVEVYFRLEELIREDLESGL
jgi:hypothetical protein